MRPILLVLALSVVSCTPPGSARLPPAQSFYYPTGLVFAPGADAAAGYLYVSSSDFDRRYDYGSVTAIDLSKLATPLVPFGSVRPASEDQIQHIFDLGLGSNAQVLVQGFTGEMVGLPVEGGVRLFTPSRSEGNFLHVIDAAGDSLSCHYAGPATNDCSAGSPSLTALQDVGNGKPRAPQPFGVGLSPEGDELWVTHLQGADTPVGSAKDIEAFTVRIRDPGAPDPDPTVFVNADSFISIGIGATNSVVVGKRYAYLTGRYVSPQGYLLRLVDRRGIVPVFTSGLEGIFRSAEARGIALATDDQGLDRRLYIAARSPDTLLVVDVLNPESNVPQVTLVRAVPLPSGATEVKVIKRPGAGRGNLVAITSNTAGVVSIYDDELGQLVAQVPNVGSQPFGVDAQPQNGGAGVRLFVSNFGDGRIAVLDMPSLDAPQNVYVVARLGNPQFCLLEQTNPACSQVSP